MTQREPTPELMRLFPPLTKWEPEIRTSVHHRIVADAVIVQGPLWAELNHLCTVWEWAAYAFRHRHAGGLSLRRARYLVRQARRLQNAYYNNDNPELYWLWNDEGPYLRLKAGVEGHNKTRSARTVRSSDIKQLRAQVLAAGREYRARNSRLTDQDVAELLSREFPDRSARTYRRWIAEG